MRRLARWCPALPVLWIMWAAPLAPLAAQDPTDPVPVRPPVADSLTREAAEAAADSVSDTGVSPGGAFLRAVLVPGWGHASIGSHGRGGFYVAAQAGTAYMLVRSRSRRADAQRVVDMREELVLQRLALEGVTDPAEVAAALEDDEDIVRARTLRNARQQQFEDWTAFGIFLVLIGGVDAFVSAHLQEFPAPVELQYTPLPEGRLELGLRVPIG